MTKIPNFSKIEFDQNPETKNNEIEQLASTDSGQHNGEQWETAEKISIKDCYTHKDIENL